MLWHQTFLLYMYMLSPRAGAGTIVIKATDWCETENKE